ncbi:MAG: MaoC family dehydratase [Desulfobacteraceae bacterium]|nr:MaoC family dehydratase [Desulfobacteraceae bacterium]
MLYLQSLFIGQFGKYITSSFFPLLPIGLIHTKQKIVQTRDINQNEILNTKFSLDKININDKGLEITFLLEITSSEEVVWKGVTTTLSKSKKYKKRKKPGKSPEALAPFTIIDIPKNIGRQYAKVSGDYNPHHLSTYFAKLFGFKRAIAHGMWSLARSIAALEKQFPGNDLFSIDVSFKRPLFLPGKASLGAVKENQSILFELRDNVTKTPHLAGTIHTR